MLNSDRTLVIGKKSKDKKRSNLNSGNHGELGQNTGDWPHEEKNGCHKFWLSIIKEE